MEEKKRRRWLAGFLAVIMTITGVGIPLPFPSEASDVWPQKSTAPYYCLDGGKGWKKVDRYDMYKFDTVSAYGNAGETVILGISGQLVGTEGRGKKV